MVKVQCQELNNKLLLSAKLVDMAKARSKGAQARRSGKMPRCQQSVPGHAMKAVCHRRHAPYKLEPKLEKSCMHARKNVSHSTLISKWFEVVSEVAGKARGRANRPRDPLIARGSPLAPLCSPGPSNFFWIPTASKHLKMSLGTKSMGSCNFPCLLKGGH